jgi:hypothetical protein
MTKIRRIGFTGHAACKGRRIIYTGFSGEVRRK